MSAPSAYRPISCDFHDLLEAHVISCRPVRIDFRDLGGTAQQRHATISDVFARDGAEYLALGTGETVRLDQLLAVNDVNISDL